MEYIQSDIQCRPNRVPNQAPSSAKRVLEDSAEADIHTMEMEWATFAKIFGYRVGVFGPDF